MARTRTEWLGRFAVGVVKNITGADLAVESVIALSTRRKHTAKDYGMYVFALARFGFGVYASGVAAGTIYDIVHLLK